jgi:hypothetical protein
LYYDTSTSARISRFLIYAGNVYAYELPGALDAIPVAQPSDDIEVPRLRKLAYAGRNTDGLAQIAIEWSGGRMACCLCIRSAAWSDYWLPYTVPSQATAFQLGDGAYAIRAAWLGEDGECASAWSDIIEFSIAEGRLASPASEPAELIDRLEVKPNWRPRPTLTARLLDTVAGKQQVVLAWDAPASNRPVRYLVSYCAENDAEWITAIAVNPNHILKLAGGEYWIRICTVDDLVSVRSEFFGEVRLILSDTDVHLDDTQSLSGMTATWMPLSDQNWIEMVSDDANRLPSLPASGDGEDAADFRALLSQSNGQGSAINIIRQLATTNRSVKQLAAAGDYFFLTGQHETARRIFQQIGRQFRGIDFSQLRLAQLAAARGNLKEADELLNAAQKAVSDSSAEHNSNITAPRVFAQHQRATSDNVAPAAVKSDTLWQRVEHSAFRPIGQAIRRTISAFKPRT